MTGKILEGIRVLDLSRLLPGPFGTAVLSDMGAEVIKVEAPDDRDIVRGMPGFNQAINHGKKSLSLNLKTEKGRDIFFKLVKRCDVLVEQFRPGVMERLGAGYEECRKHNPKLIYASLSGYGSRGPYAEKAGHDLNYLSLSGIAGITGVDSGELAIPGVQIADLTGGLYLVIGILAGLQYVCKTGKGLRVEVSMFESCLSLVGIHLADFFLNRKDPGPGTMNLNGGLPNYHLYQTRDGRWISLGALEGKFWSNFCKKAGKPEWENRLWGNAEELVKLKEELKELFRSRTLEEWEKLASDPDLCLEPVRKFSEIEEDPQVKSRGLILSIHSQGGREYRVIRSPVRFCDFEQEQLSPAPEKGQDNREILLSLGYSESEIGVLKKEGVI